MIPAPDAGAGQPAPVRESDVFGLTTPGLLEAARDYVRLDRVHRPRRRAERIAAEVDGTDATYACHADVRRGAGVAPDIAPNCECPSHRPYCKHVLALLLLWAENPAAFAPLDAWEAELRARSPVELAELLADSAMGADALQLLAGAAAVPAWLAEPPGRCLQEWGRFRSWAEASGVWPAAALQLGARIAGPPGSPAAAPQVHVAHPAVAARQLAWWLTRMMTVLPEPALLPWVEHLFARLDALGRQPREAPPPELGVWLARVAAALPPARDPERSWLARFAAHVPTLAPVFEAELQRARWEAELTLRLAVAPALPTPGAALAESGHVAALRAFVEARAGA